MIDVSVAQLNKLNLSRQNARWRQLLELAFPTDPPAKTPAFEESLQAAAANARNHAIFHERDVARFICLTYSLGESFDTQFPAAKDILADTTRPADERLSLLECWADELVSALGSES